MSEGQQHDHVSYTVEHLRRIAEHNAGGLKNAANLVLNCLRADGLIFTAGAGHSLTGAMESFHRAGGLAAVYPLYHPDLLMFHGAAASTSAERRAGFATEVLNGSGFRGGTDLLVVFSNSGINPYPVELAIMARQRGSTVVAVTSPTASAGAPRRAGSTLAAEANIVLDTLVPAGDVSYPRAAPVTAALSSLANGLLWNQLLVELYDAASAADVDLPLWRSSNVTGGDEANAASFERYERRVPWLR